MRAETLRHERPDTMTRKILAGAAAIVAAGVGVLLGFWLIGRFLKRITVTVH